MTLPAGLTPSVTEPPTPVADRAARFSQRLLRPFAYAAGAILLFLVYLRLATRVPYGADGAVIEQQAWDMLHGNVYLHGWALADISFYTIEIPEFAVIEWLHGGMGPEVLRIAEALNLTLVVLFVALVAKGRATGREGLVRALIAAGIVFAPVPGPNGTLMLANPDHLATQIPLLAVWLIIDRARPRWWVPVAVATLLAWARMSDSIVLLEGLIPLMVVCAMRVYRRRGPLRGNWYDLSLAAAAIAAEGVAQLALRTIHAAGGYSAYPLQESVAPIAQLSTHFWVMAEDTLQLYGADISGAPLSGSLNLLIPAVHLIGVLLAVAATWYAVRRFFASDLMLQVVTAALVISVVAFTLLQHGSTPAGSAHDIMPVLPAGAVLAGRVLTSGAIRRGLLPALAVALALYAGFFTYDVTQLRPAIADASLAAWLQDQHLRYGLSDYYAASLLTVDDSGQVMVAPVKRIGDQLVLSPWLSTTSWYDPASHDATFFVATQMQNCPPGSAGLWVTAAERAFGPPVRTYYVAGAQVLVWNHNLLTDQLPAVPMGRPSAC
jgi:hypothetical protein